MGKLRVLSGQAVCQILAEHGFVAVRQRGSHIIMQLKTEETTTTVPVQLCQTPGI
ncbi:MAG: type II toxin-antitoxin system HicA family toxin [Verrucomicrobia bacterium]|nr:type II toxin-antitoxin system HicA family toxin [Leptolyngbya sp. ES-bin-22]